MSILTTQIMKKHWNKFRLSKKCIAFLMNNASVFSGEMTMIANSYLTYSFSRSVTPRTLRKCPVSAVYFFDSILSAVT